MSVKNLKIRAFTLTELLVVVAIMAVLTSIIMPNISGSRAKARDAQRISDVSQLQLAVQLYYDRCGQYPSSLAVGINNGCPSGSNATLGTYISQIPTPPAGAGQTAYDYAVPSSGAVINYVIHTVLEQTNAAVAKGLNAMPSGVTWSATYTCSNISTSVNYCVSSN